jgi:hypothetical protein
VTNVGGATKPEGVQPVDRRVSFQKADRGDRRQATDRPDLDRISRLPGT